MKKTESIVLATSEGNREGANTSRRVPSQLTDEHENLQDPINFPVAIPEYMVNVHGVAQQRRLLREHEETYSRRLAWPEPVSIRRELGKEIFGAFEVWRSREA